MEQTKKEVRGLFIEELEVRAAPAPFWATSMIGAPNAKALANANWHAPFVPDEPIYTTLALGEESGSPGVGNIYNELET